MGGSRIGAAAVLAVGVAAGLALGGRWIGEGFARGRAADRYVTVKGLAEREVAADLAIWPIVYNTTADELGEVYARIDRDASTIIAFLAQRGFAPSDVTRSMPRLTDFEAQGGGGPNRPIHRYLAEAAVTLRTPDVTGVKEAMQAAAELVKQGVTLVRSYEATPQFLYTRLDAIKPEMIAEATIDARRAAEQFARDSDSRVGAIRRASQGYFSIEDRDPHAPEFKRVRVVTTVEYFLAD